jgi:hypothetical protein
MNLYQKHLREDYGFPELSIVCLRLRPSQGNGSEEIIEGTFRSVDFELVMRNGRFGTISIVDQDKVVDAEQYYDDLDVLLGIDSK